MTHRDRVVVAGYLVRCPLAGYAWQVLHYLVGLRALGFDPYFYEDTAYHGVCFNPATGAMNDAPGAGVAFARDFFDRYGFGDRWVFWDAARNQHHGLGADATAELLWDARIVLTLAAVTRLPRRQRERKLFVDIDPTFTQIRLAQSDRPLRGLLAEHDLHFTIGENIGRRDCAIPTGGFEWRATRQPIATALWDPLPSDPTGAFTTIGRWDEGRRDVHFKGEVYSWRKRVEWMKFIDLPTRTGEAFTPAMDIDKIPHDATRLQQHGWHSLDPLSVSRDAQAYRDFIRRSKGEFTVAKDLNVRLASGWFSDRSACYLAAGRPVVTQDTGFSRSLPTGAGLFAVRDIDGAIAAVRAIADDYDHHVRAARRIAVEQFDSSHVLERMVADL